MTFAAPARPTLFPELRAAVIDHRPLWHDIARAGQVRPDFADHATLRLGLSDAELWWIDDACCGLLTQVAPTMPPVTLTTELIPAAQGFVYFEHPIIGVDSHTGAEIAIDYLQWQPLFLRGQPAIAIVPWADTDPSAHVPPTPLGRSDWPLDTLTDMRFHHLPDLVHRSMVEDRRLLAALWQLTAQQTITRTTETPVEKAARRRLARAGHEPSPVRLVNLARTRSTRHNGAQQAGREYSCQWPVVGHWRQQPYGPGRSLRKAIYIQPQIRGPEDKPLRVRDTVKVWQQ